MSFTTREQVIEALHIEFNENPKSFTNNEKTKQREKLWSFSRLHKHYWGLKCGTVYPDKTVLNPKTGYYELIKK